jgi:hypothetical protein
MRGRFSGADDTRDEVGVDAGGWRNATCTTTEAEEGCCTPVDFLAIATSTETSSESGTSHKISPYRLSLGGLLAALAAANPFPQPESACGSLAVEGGADGDATRRMRNCVTTMCRPSPTPRWSRGGSSTASNRATKDGVGEVDGGGDSRPWGGAPALPITLVPSPPLPPPLMGASLECGDWSAAAVVDVRSLPCFLLEG